jgi:hypothetical protein
MPRIEVRIEVEKNLDTEQNWGQVAHDSSTSGFKENIVGLTE